MQTTQESSQNRLLAEALQSPGVHRYIIKKQILESEDKVKVIKSWAVTSQQNLKSKIRLLGQSLVDKASDLKRLKQLLRAKQILEGNMQRSFKPVNDV